MKILGVLGVLLVTAIAHAQFGVPAGETSGTGAIGIQTLGCFSQAASAGIAVTPRYFFAAPQTSVGPLCPRLIDASDLPDTIFRQSGTCIANNVMTASDTGPEVQCNSCRWLPTGELLCPPTAVPGRVCFGEAADSPQNKVCFTVGNLTDSPTITFNNKGMPPAGIAAVGAAHRSFLCVGLDEKAFTSTVACDVAPTTTSTSTSTTSTVAPSSTSSTSSSSTTTSTTSTTSTTTAGGACTLKAGLSNTSNTDDYWSTHTVYTESTMAAESLHSSQRVNNNTGATQTICRVDLCLGRSAAGPDGLFHMEVWSDQSTCSLFVPNTVCPLAQVGDDSSDADADTLTNTLTTVAPGTGAACGSDGNRGQWVQLDFGGTQPSFGSGVHWWYRLTNNDSGGLNQAIRWGSSNGSATYSTSAFNGFAARVDHADDFLFRTYTVD